MQITYVDRCSKNDFIVLKESMAVRLTNHYMKIDRFDTAL